MFKIFTTKTNTPNKWAIIGLSGFVLAFILLNLLQDLIRANLNGTGYYFSESFLFSSFFWFFGPFLFAQYFFARRYQSKSMVVLFLAIALPLALHAISFPMLVWAVSKAFYYHTFSYLQTLRYTLSEHIYLLLLFYTIPFLVYRFFLASRQAEKFQIKQKDAAIQFANSILVSEGNKKLPIPVGTIWYFSASPPYINIHVDEKKYLHNDSLKAVSSKLNPAQFIRIHKSAIVNIEMVASFSSRLNGDYDLTLKNNTVLRLSRNFASHFKQIFQPGHQVTKK